MTAVVGRAWGWVRPALSYRPWASSAVSEKAMRDKPVTEEGQMRGSWGLGGLTTWVWGGQKKESDQTKQIEEFWEAEEKIQPMEIEDLRAGKQETEAKAEHASRWWNNILPSSYSLWPKASGTSGLKQRKCVGWNEGGWDSDQDGEYSDYGTPPPSPTPSTSHQSSPFRFFARSWTGDIVPEHYEICFNFLRHLFDLFVVGFLWTVSPPTKLILEVFGVQGALKLWLHGMAMFLVSTVGMAGLLWLIQEYLPEFALVYGIVQAIVISVSVRQSVILGEGAELEEEKGEKEENLEKDEEMKDHGEHEEMHLTPKERLCLE